MNNDIPAESIDSYVTIRELVRGAAPRRLASSIEPNSRLREDLGFDSIGLMTLAFQLEAAFDVDLSEHAERYRHIATVNDVANFISVVLVPVPT